MPHDPNDLPGCPSLLWIKPGGYLTAQLVVAVPQHSVHADPLRLVHQHPHLLDIVLILVEIEEAPS